MQQMPLMGMQNQNQMMFPPPQFNGGMNFFPGQGSAPWPALQKLFQPTSVWWDGSGFSNAAASVPNATAVPISPTQPNEPAIPNAEQQQATVSNEPAVPDAATV
ncbi:Uncharacterized protein Rs2_48652 [Raphanus sativus]|nr:Uncharacterized protein Rs2_48652 [Raphanus sativus]